MKPPLRENASELERPWPVYLISGFYVLSWLCMLPLQLILFFGLFEDLVGALVPFGRVSQGQALVSIALGMVSAGAGVLLYLLRKEALWLFIAELILSFLYLIGSDAATQLFEPLEPLGDLGLLVGWSSLILGWSISIGVCTYVWILYRRGILR